MELSLQPIIGERSRSVVVFYRIECKCEEDTFTEFEMKRFLSEILMFAHQIKESSSEFGLILIKVFFFFICYLHRNLSPTSSHSNLIRDF